MASYIFTKLTNSNHCFTFFIFIYREDCGFIIIIVRQVDVDSWWLHESKCDFLARQFFGSDFLAPNILDSHSALVND